jgi:signal transduction histidine kinase
MERDADGLDTGGAGRVDSATAGLLAALGAALFERVGPGHFAPAGPLPAWFARLYPEAGSGTVALGEHSPFLEAFLYEAEPFWEANDGERLASGPWVEVDETGREHHLEATALGAGGASFLLVEFARIPYEETLAVFQTGRETILARERLEKEVQKKEVLLHCIVHDLKGPLTGIVGAVGILAARDAQPAQREFLDLALRQANRLDMLIQGILGAFSAEVEALESFVFDPASAPDAFACAAEAAMSMASAFSLSKVELELDPSIDEDLDWSVVADKARLERVLSNLLGNALRYSPRGSTVTIGLAREEAGDDGARVLVSVADQGPGVPEDVAGRLFQKFSQGKGKAGSAGLGLYFCRITVERWGGSIGYSPRPEGGARFWFALRSATR